MFNENLSSDELDKRAQGMSTSHLKMNLEFADQRWANQEFDDTAANTAVGHQLLEHMEVWKKELLRRGESITGSSGIK